MIKVLTENFEVIAIKGIYIKEKCLNRKKIRTQ